MEEVLPPQTQHGAGFELTRVRQFTVFLENRVGRLTMLMRALEEGDRIVALSIEESADAALVRLITVCSALLAAEINIHYIYPLLVRPSGPAVVLYVDDPTLAAQILIRKGFT